MALPVPSIDELSAKARAAYASALGLVEAIIWPNTHYVHGLPKGLDRLKAVGNAIVPQIAELIGRGILKADGRTAAGAL